MTPLGATVVVLSHGLWTTEFGARDVVGQKLRIGTLDYTIIGVAPDGFVGTASGRAPELFVPITTIPASVQPSSARTYFTDYNWDWTDILVRRKPGASVAAANADLSDAYRQSRATYRLVNPRVLPDSIARPHAIVGSVRGSNGPDPGSRATSSGPTSLAGV